MKSSGNRVSLVAILLTIFTLIVSWSYGFSQNEIAPEQIRSIAWNPSGDYLAIGYQNGKIKIISINDKQTTFLLEGHSSAVITLAWSPDGEMLASGSIYPDTTLNIWDGTSGQSIFTTSNFGVDVVTVGWTPDNSRVVAITAEPFNDETNSIIVNPISGEVTTLSLGVSWDMEWDTSGQSMALASIGGLGIYNAITFQPVLGIAIDNTTFLTDVRWKPDGNFIAGGTADGRIFLWSKNGSEPIFTLTGNDYEGEERLSRWIQDLRFDYSGQQLTSVAGDGSIRTWDVKSGTLVAEQKSNLNYTAAFSPYGGRIALGLLASDSSNVDRSDSTILKDVGVQIIVPDASIEKLQSIAGQCFEEGNATAVKDLQAVNINEADLADFTAQIKALPVDAIPAACQADLIAVAEAIIAQE